MNETEFRLKFSGAEAKASRVSAKAGSETLAGFSAALARIAHYSSTSEVRFREPFSDDITFYISHTEPGSLDFIYLAVRKTAKGATSALDDLGKLLKNVIAVATGQSEASNVQLSNGVRTSGDIEALAEAIEPSLKRAHRWIDGNSKNLSFSIGSEKIKLSKKTKDYLDHEEFDESKDVQDVSVGALNVNSRNGRVFFHDLGRTVSFYVSKEAEDRTIPMLSRYLSEYAEKSGATVNIQFRRIYYSDGRLKRITIYDCYPISQME